MSQGNYINIGGVRFNKDDVKKSEQVKENGHTLNSVFMKDGTKVVFPNQNPKNESIVLQSEIIEHEDSGFGMRLDGSVGSTFGQPGSIDFGGKDVKTGEYETDFYRMSGARVTGTDKKDDYTLEGCANSKIDLSQKDGESDYVTMKDDNSGEYRSLSGKKIVEQHSTKAKYKSANNKAVLGEERDTAITKNKDKKHWYQSSKKWTEGPATVKE